MKALDPGVGEQDVDAAEFLFAAGGSRSQRRQVALVKLDAEPSAASLPDQSACLLQVVGSRGRA
jgi:hypothetical protein